MRLGACTTWIACQLFVLIEWLLVVTRHSSFSSDSCAVSGGVEAMVSICVLNISVSKAPLVHFY